MENSMNLFLVVLACICTLEATMNSVTADHSTGQQCGVHEILNRCAGCDNDACPVSSGYPTDDGDCIAPTVCFTQCQCAPGFKRNTSGVCILQGLCPGACGEHEILNLCPSRCITDACPTNLNQQLRLPCERRRRAFIPRCGTPRCECKENFKRNLRGNCIPVQDCLVGLIAMDMANVDLDALLKDSNDEFTAKMFTEVVNKNPDKSVILSAFSVLSPLAQLALACVGESHDELLNTIRFPNDNVTKQVFENVNTTSRLRSVKGVVLRMANRIYTAEDAQLNPDFDLVSRNVFNSDVKNVDFSKSDKTASDVNAWFEQETNNKIKDLIGPKSLEDTTRGLLVNAIYIKGLWKIPFKKADTKDANFHVTKENIVQVPTMHNKDTFRYGESTELDAKLLELPYEGSEWSFLIVLPNKVDGLKELKEKLKNPAALTKAAEEMYTTDVIVSIPKFKIETTTYLKEVLQKMGVKLLFDSGKAKLNNLLSEESNLYISDAIQNAFIEVNEEGAEAAVANAFLYSKSGNFTAETMESFEAFIGLGIAPSLPKPEPKLFVVDKPFYFQILNARLPLFEGTCHRPLTFEKVTHGIVF